MSRALVIGTICLFALIGSLGLIRKRKLANEAKQPPVSALVLEQEADKTTCHAEAAKEVIEANAEAALAMLAGKDQEDKFAAHQVDNIRSLFARGPHKSPIVQTVKYMSKVSWIKGRPAWIADYATHFKTSRHFIARSLNQKLDYETQKVSRGDYFNVLSEEKDINFFMVLDVSRAKMWFFYHDLDSGEKVCLKTLSVGLGRVSPDQASGTLTPLGVFRLGDKVAAYKKGAYGPFQDTEVELIQVFGTRWIPFAEEVSGIEISAKGYGLHGAPWDVDEGENYTENLEVIGKYESDGCVRLAQKDIEEIYAIVITRPTYVEIVKDCRDSTLFDFEAIAN